MLFYFKVWLRPCVQTINKEGNKATAQHLFVYHSDMFRLFQRVYHQAVHQDTVYKNEISALQKLLHVLCACVQNVNGSVK